MTADELEAIVWQSVGEASVCWSSRPDGIFDERRAVRISRQILQAINDYIIEHGGTTLAVRQDEEEDERGGTLV